MKQFIASLLISTCAVALIGCKGSSDSSRQLPDTEANVPAPNVSADPNEITPPENTIPSADTFEISGTVLYKNFEGGFFAIDGDDGSKYDPISLPESFRKDGLKVKVTARLRKDAMSMHMYGSIIEVVTIAVQ